MPESNEDRNARLYREAAKELYEDDNECDIEIDDDAALSIAEVSDGAWVAAWVFVHNDNVPNLQVSDPVATEE